MNRRKKNREHKEREFLDLKRLIKRNAFACEDLDTDLGRENSQSLYNADFSIIYPLTQNQGLHQRAVDNALDLDAISYEMITLSELYNNISGFQIVVSFPAFIEMLASIENRLLQLEEIRDNKAVSENLYHNLNAYREQAITGKVTEQDLLKSNSAKTQLRSLIGLIPNDQESANITRVLHLFERRVIRGLGDYYTSSEIDAARNGRQYFNRVLERIDRFRSSESHLGGRGDPDSKDFHRRVDAWNITLSRQLHELKEQQRLMFLGPPKLCRVYESSEDVLSRSVVAPFLRLKSLSLAPSSTDIDADSRARIRKFGRRLSEAWDLLDKASSIDDLYTAEIETVREAYEEIVSIYHAGAEEASVIEEERRKSISELLRNPTSLRDKAAEVQDQMQRDADRIVSLSPEPLDDDVAEAYELRDNKRMKRIMKKFGRA